MHEAALHGSLVVSQSWGHTLDSSGREIKLGMPP